MSALSSSKSFPKSVRILHKSDYQRLRIGCSRIFGQNVALQLSKRGRPVTRLGITISKKFGKAHDRNRFKRCVREVFREVRADLPMGIEINIFPQKHTTLLSWKETAEELKDLFSKVR